MRSGHQRSPRHQCWPGESRDEAHCPNPRCLPKHARWRCFTIRRHRCPIARGLHPSVRAVAIRRHRNERSVFQLGTVSPRHCGHSGTGIPSNRYRSAVRTRLRRDDNEKVGSSPVRAASYAALRPQPTSSPASSIETVGCSRMSGNFTRSSWMSWCIARKVIVRLNPVDATDSELSLGTSTALTCTNAPNGREKKSAGRADAPIVDHYRNI